MVIAEKKDVVDVLAHAYHQGLTTKPGYAFLGLDHNLEVIKRSSEKMAEWKKLLGRDDALDIGWY